MVDDLGWVATGEDVNEVVDKLDACAAERIEWASRRDLQFDTANTAAALLTRRGGYKKHLQLQLTAKINVGNGFVRFNKETTRLLGVLMDAHLTFKEHHNSCMKRARAAAARVSVLTKLHGIIPQQVRAVQIACIQAVALYASELWLYPGEIGR